MIFSLTTSHLCTLMEVFAETMAKKKKDEAIGILFTKKGKVVIGIIGGDIGEASFLTKLRLDANKPNSDVFILSEEIAKDYGMLLI